MMKSRVQIVLWVLVHFLLFNGLFGLREAPRMVDYKTELFNTGQFEGSVFDHLRLYFSQIQDEAYYYEWSTVVLGREFESDYPLEQRAGSPVAEFFGEEPRVRLPYRDISYEYPPILMIPLLAARFVTSDYVSFTRVLAFLISMAYLAGLGLLYALWKRIPDDKKISFPSIMGLSALSVLLLGQIFVTRLDVFPSLVYLLVLYLFFRERYYLSALCIGIGFFTKAYPILLAPLFGLYLLHEKQWRPLLASAFIVIVAIVGGGLGLGLLTEGAYWDAYRFHASRGIQIESLYAQWPLLAHYFTDLHIQVYGSHNAFNIWMPGIMKLIKLSSVVPLVVFAFLYGAFWYQLRKSPKLDPVYSIVRSAFLLVFAFLLTFKVFSPQFLIWLVPLVFLIHPLRVAFFFSLFIVLLANTQLIWPNFYFTYIVHAESPGILLLFIRNAGLAFLFLYLLWDWWRDIRVGSER